MMGHWGNDAINALKQVYELGLRKESKIFFNSIGYTLASGVPADALDGVTMGWWWYHDLSGLKDPATENAVNEFAKKYLKEYGDIPDTFAMYSYVAMMETLRGAVASLLPGSAVRIEGSTDMTVGGRKVAGNAQRRGTTHLLFHGVFLLDLDLHLLEELLPLPSRQPAYRRARPHREFVCNLPLPSSAVKRAIAGAWRAVAEPLEVPVARIRGLLDARYHLRSWNLRR